MTNAGSHFAARQSVQAWLPESNAHSLKQFLTTQPTVSSKQVTHASERPVPILMQVLVWGSAPSDALAQSPVILATSFVVTIIWSAALVQAPIAMPVPVEPVALVVVPVVVLVVVAPVVVEALPPVPAVAVVLVAPPPAPVALVEPPEPVEAVVPLDPQAMMRRAAEAARSARSGVRDMGWTFIEVAREDSGGREGAGNPTIRPANC